MSVYGHDSDPCLRPELVRRMGEMMAKSSRHLSWTTGHGAMILLAQEGDGVEARHDTHLIPENITECRESR